MRRIPRLLSVAKFCPLRHEQATFIKQISTAICSCNPAFYCVGQRLFLSFCVVVGTAFFRLGIVTRSPRSVALCFVGLQHGVFLVLVATIQARCPVPEV